MHPEHSIGIRWAALFLGILAATPAEARQLDYGEAIQLAKALMLNGRPADARSLLRELETRYRSSNDIDFLLGLLAVDSKEYDLAIGHFRTMLARQPDAVRVRLELARAFYLKRDYENAYRQFQFARAGRLPAEVIGSIDRFLAAIREGKSWSYSMTLSVAPDTNINNGTSARDLVLFGLPFELGEETRQRSGIGAAIDTSAEFAPRIGEHARLKLGAAMLRRDYRDNNFDDTAVALYAGPRLVFDKWNLSATATGFQRRFGGTRLSQGFGGKLDGTYYADARTALSLNLAAQQVRYPRYDLQSGRVYSASAAVIRALAPSSNLNARIGLSRKEARVPELASWSQSISVGYYRDFPGGFSIYAEPAVSRSRYDAADPFFGERRRDRLVELRLGILNRRIVVRGFTPRVAFTFTRRKSTIELFDYTQRRLEAGLTSAF